jgi:hypothetical protein
MQQLRTQQLSQATIYLRMKILKLISSGPSSAAKIAHKLCVSREVIKGHLRRMTAAHQIIRVTRGTFQLAPRPQSTDPMEPMKPTKPTGDDYLNLYNRMKATDYYRKQGGLSRDYRFTELIKSVGYDELMEWVANEEARQQ